MIYKIKQKHTKHMTIYTMIKSGTKKIWKNMINETGIKAAKLIRCIYLLHMIYISSHLIYISLNSFWHS